MDVSATKNGRRRAGSMAMVAALLMATLALGACQPAAVHCKTTMHKYDHKTLFVTWFTLYNEMRFCYNGKTATSIQWATNRTSSPTFPYTNDGVTDSTGLESYGGGAGVRRARNISYHAIGCAKISGGFTVTMRQFGYGSGNVTKYRSSINNSKDC